MVVLLWKLSGLFSDRGATALLWLLLRYSSFRCEPILSSKQLLRHKAVSWCVMPVLCCTHSLGGSSIRGCSSHELIQNSSQHFDCYHCRSDKLNKHTRSANPAAPEAVLTLSRAPSTPRLHIQPLHATQTVYDYRFHCWKASFADNTLLSPALSIDTETSRDPNWSSKGQLTCCTHRMLP